MSIYHRNRILEKTLTLALFTPVALMLLLPLTVFSQTPQTPIVKGKTKPPPNDPRDPDPDDETTTDPKKTQDMEKINAKKTPSNPLVLKQPDGRGNATTLYDEKGRRIEPAIPKRKKNFGDYRGKVLDPRLRTQTDEDEELPLFGYNFFEPARNYLIAKQEYVQRALRGDYAPEPQYDETDPEADYDTTDATSTERSTRKIQPRTNPDGTRIGKVPSTKKTTRRNTGTRPNPDTEADTEDPAMTPRRKVRSNTKRTTDLQDEMTQTDEGDYAETPTRAAPPLRRNRTETQTQPRRRTGSAQTDSMQTDPRNPRDANNRITGNRTQDETDPQYDETAPLPRQSRRRATRPYNNAPDPNLFSDTNAFSNIADPLAQLRGNVLASVPTTYILSGGDKLIVTYRTPTIAETELRISVDAQGAISVPEAGRVVVGGLTIAQAQAAIERRLGTIFRGVSVSLTLEELRTIIVTVSGEAFRAGSYPVPSVTSAINVLYAAGGPTERGSLRRIEVRRQGKLAGTIDIYKFLTGGEQPDIPLQSGDLITIPPRQSDVTVKGEVRNPAIYELKDNETLQDALRFAGGIKPSGIAQNVRIETVIPGRERVIRTVDTKTNAQTRAVTLYDGDLVDVFSVRDTVANKVTIEGALEQPGDYAFTPGMRVSDLVDKARSILPEAYTPRAELYKWNPDNTTTLIAVDLEKAIARDPTFNLVLSRWDRLKVYTREEVAWTGTRRVELTGAVQRPGIYQRSEGMRLSDLLRRAGGPTPDAYLNRAIVLHQRGDGSFAYDYPNLFSAIKGDLTSDVFIEDNDLVAVYKTSEANFTPERVVSIRGEVVAPGVYPRGESMKLSDLIKNAGGFKPGATPNVTVAHARRFVDATNQQTKTVSIQVNDRGGVSNDLVLDDGDVVTIQADGSFQSEVRIVTIKGFVNRPGPIVLSRKGMRLSDAIREAGGVRAEGSPEGTEFNRDPKLLASSGQKTIMQKVSELSDLINSSVYRRELAKSDIERAKALKTVETDGGGLLGGLGGLTGAAAPPPTASNPVVAQNLANRDLVSRPRSLIETDLTPNGNIAVNLPEALKKPGSEEDLLLVDGDMITIPEKPTTVQISGAVVNPRGVLFKTGANIDYYITRAGGFAPDVAKDRIVIIRAGGGIFPAGKAGAIRAGDLIFVPTKVVAERISANGNLFNDLFKGIASTAISLLLVTKLFGI